MREASAPLKGVVASKLLPEIGPPFRQIEQDPIGVVEGDDREIDRSPRTTVTEDFIRLVFQLNGVSSPFRLPPGDHPGPGNAVYRGEGDLQVLRARTQVGIEEASLEDARKQIGNGAEPGRDRTQNARLPVCVGAVQDREPGVELQGELLDRAEVLDLYGCQLHGPVPSALGGPIPAGRKCSVGGPRRGRLRCSAIPSEEVVGRG